MHNNLTQMNGILTGRNTMEKFQYMTVLDKNQEIEITCGNLSAEIYESLEENLEHETELEYKPGKVWIGRNCDLISVLNILGQYGWEAISFNIPGYKMVLMKKRIE